MITVISWIGFEEVIVVIIIVIASEKIVTWKGKRRII